MVLAVLGRDWLPLGLLLSVFACKGGEDPVQELCELTLSCSCSAPPYATVETCVADYNGEADQLKAEATTNGLTFNQGCFNTVIDVISEVGCEGDGAGLFASCSDRCALIHGDKPIGAACNIFGQAGQFGDCARSLACIEGKCSERCERLPAGAACSDGEFSPLGLCDDGLYCDYFESRICRPLGDVGDPCTGGAFSDCKEGLRCSAEAKCAVGPGEGEACVTSCASGFECSDAEVCVAREPRLCESLTW